MNASFTALVKCHGSCKIISQSVRAIEPTDQFWKIFVMLENNFVVETPVTAGENNLQSAAV